MLGPPAGMGVGGGGGDPPLPCALPEAPAEALIQLSMAAKALAKADAVAVACREEATLVKKYYCSAWRQCSADRCRSAHHGCGNGLSLRVGRGTAASHAGRAGRCSGCTGRQVTPIWACPWADM